jgi:hypothetical protein
MSTKPRTNIKPVRDCHPQLSPIIQIFFICHIMYRNIKNLFRELALGYLPVLQAHNGRLRYSHITMASRQISLFGIPYCHHRLPVGMVPGFFSP